MNKRLITIGLTSLAIYIFLGRLYPLGPSLAVPRATWAIINKESLPWFFVHIAMYLGLVLLYMAAMHLLRGLSGNTAGSGGISPERRRWLNIMIVAIWLSCSFALMTASPAGESHDLFDYVFRGRMMAENDANPLVDIPTQYNKNAYYHYIAWHKHVDTYGPLWEAASKGLSSGVHYIAESLGWWVPDLPSCPNSQPSCRLLILYISSYRLMTIGLTGISAWLITLLVKRTQPKMVSLALVAWLWNPLTLIVTALGGHNDLWMIVLILVAILLIQRNLPYWAIMALILAGHFKLIALLFAPAFGLWILAKWGWRRTLGVGIASLFSSVAVSWLLYAPFGGWSSLPRMLQERSQFYSNSIWDMLATMLENLNVPWPTVYHLTVNLPSVLFLIAILWLTLSSLNLLPNRWKKPAFNLEDRHFWTILVKTSLLYLILGAFWFQHWYFIWLLAPAVLLPGNWFTLKILPWLCFGGLMVNLGSNMLDVFLGDRMSDLLRSLIMVGIIWVPGLIAYLILRLRRKPEIFTMIG